MIINLENKYCRQDEHYDDIPDEEFEKMKKKIKRKAN